MSINDDCGISNSTLAIVDQLHFLSYKFLNQIYLILGVSCNITLLIAFYKQSKTEGAYGYQVVLAVSKILEVLSFSIFLTTLKCFSGAENQEAEWFVRNYAIMYLTARLGPVAHMVFIVVSLFLTLSMAADRMFAMTKPFVYNKINRFRHQAIATCICFAIGVASSVSDAWRYDVGGVPGHYKLITNEEYVKTTFAIMSAHIRTAVRVIGVIGLITLNIFTVIMYRRRSRKVQQMTINQDQKKKERAEKNLLILTVCQSILMAINQIPHMGYHVLAYLVPSFTRCAGMIYSPTADAMVMLTDSVDLFIVIGVNKRMRTTVIRAFGCKVCCKAGNNIGTTGIEPTGGTRNN